YEVTRRIRQNKALPYIPIILLTAHAESSASEGLKIGADGFLRKPYDIDELLICMQSLLKREPALCR
ncbi:MAG: response regulator, partial [Phormidesmis sp.]